MLDFDFIEKGVDAEAPKYMEWYAALGLLVTLVWLYLEILHLLSKARKKWGAVPAARRLQNVSLSPVVSSELDGLSPMALN